MRAILPPDLRGDVDLLPGFEGPGIGQLLRDLPPDRVEDLDRRGAEGRRRTRPPSSPLLAAGRQAAEAAQAMSPHDERCRWVFDLLHGVPPLIRLRLSRPAPADGLFQLGQGDGVVVERLGIVGPGLAQGDLGGADVQVVASPSAKLSSAIRTASRACSTFFSCDSSDSRAWLQVQDGCLDLELDHLWPGPSGSTRAAGARPWTGRPGLVREAVEDGDVEDQVDRIVALPGALARNSSCRPSSCRCPPTASVGR